MHNFIKSVTLFSQYIKRLCSYNTWLYTYVAMQMLYIKLYIQLFYITRTLHGVVVRTYLLYIINEETIIMSNSCFSIRSSSYVIKFLSISSSSSSFEEIKIVVPVSFLVIELELKQKRLYQNYFSSSTENWNNTINYKYI